MSTQNGPIDYNHHENHRGIRTQEAHSITPEKAEYEMKRRSLEQWLETARAQETYDGEVFERVCEAMSSIFEFLAGVGESNPYPMRVWALLYAVRPDLIEYESTESFARRLGVHPSCIQDKIKLLERNVPGFHVTRRKPSGENISRGLRRASSLRRTYLKRDGADLLTPDSLSA